MTHGMPGRDALAGTDDEPYAVLPRPAPLWFRRLETIYMAIELAAYAIMLLAIVIGWVGWVFGRVT